MIIRKIILLFILSLSAIAVKAQLDLEHWFPSLHIPKSYSPIPETVELNVSTPHSEDFKIKIYGGKQLILETIISNSKPLKYDVPFSNILLSANLAMKPTESGIYIAGEKSFFADLRISFSHNYTELITSKGKSSLGKEFLNANAPISLYEGYQSLNMQTSIMAYYDNTNVKIYGYNPKINFTDKSSENFLEFTLNRGETYVASLLKRDNYDLYDNEYINSFIGASISSDKPIIVSNGGLNGTGSFEGANIMYDQNLPIKNIGTEYYFQKGKSDLRKGIEKAIVIANEKNTEIFINGNSNPIATINKGAHYIIKSENFLNDGLYIKTSKPSYVYQIMSGSNTFKDKTDYSFLSYGMALVPPIDVNPAKDINFLQNLNKINNADFETNLLIISEKNKNTLLNNTNIDPNYGPFNIIGNSNLEYFLIKNFKGNAQIKSSGKIISGITAGLPTFAGHAGYYTGFSNDPFITQNGNCIQESVILSLNNKDFEKIQWQINGSDIAGANSETYIPTLPGTYRCKLTYAYGEFNYYTNEIFVDNCPYKVSDLTLKNICSGNSFTITPEFSQPNVKFDVIKTEILTLPLQGNAKLSGTDIIVNINNLFSGDNRIVYKITASNGFYEIINAKFKVYSNPNQPIFESIDPIGVDKNKFIYNLNDALTLANNSGFTYKFYSSQNDAIQNINEIKTPTSYKTIQKNAFIKTINTNDCFSIKEIILNQPNLPPTTEPDSTVFPNTVTPNDDGYNDVWNFETLQEYTNLQIIIFDKQGSKVYEYSKGKPFYWDGRSLSGTKLPSGVYWVILKGINPEKNEILNKSQWLYLKNRN